MMKLLLLLSISVGTATLNAMHKSSRHPKGNRSWILYSVECDMQKSAYRRVEQESPFRLWPLVAQEMRKHHNNEKINEMNTTILSNETKR